MGTRFTFAPNFHWPPLGYGVEGMGFNRPQGLAQNGAYHPSRNVKRSFAPLEGGVTYQLANTLPTTLQGNGATLTGKMALQALVNLQAAQAAAQKGG